MSYQKAMKHSRNIRKQRAQGRMYFGFSAMSGFTPSGSFLKEDYWPYIEACKAAGVEPLECQEFYNLNLRGGVMSSMDLEQQVQFTLQNDRQKPVLWKPPPTEKQRQTVLFSGLGLLPGQGDLFPTDGPPEKSPQQRQVEAMTEPGSSLYRNKQGDVLIATPYEKGLWRTIIHRDGNWTPAFSGPVDTDKWTLIQSPAPA